MKRCCLFLLIILSASLSIADTITVVQVPPVSVEKLQTNKFGYWDFRFIKDSIINEIVVSSDKNDTTVIHVLRDNTRFIYRMTNDSLFCLGYENSTTKMHYDEPYLMFVFPLTVGKHIKGAYVGEGEYCHLLPLYIEVKYDALIEEKAPLWLPDCRIDSVYKVCLSSEITEISSSDTTKFFLHNNLWFSGMCNYPVLEVKELQSIYKDTCRTESFAYYFPLFVEDEPMETLDTIVDNIILADSVLTAAHFVPNPVVTSLQIEYNLTREADVYFSLHNSLGLNVYTSTLEHQSSGEHVHCIYMESFPIGDYVLYIHVNNIVIAETIIKS